MQSKLSIFFITMIVIATLCATENDLVTVIMETSLGVMEFELNRSHTPLTVDNFIGLAIGSKEWKDPFTNQWVSRPFYDGLIFHRVISGFMIQGGCPLGTGTGGPGYRFPDEFPVDEDGNLLDTVDYGSICMANSGANTNGSQFFIVTNPNGCPWLDGHHTVFGRVISGLEVAHSIESVATNSNDKPLEDVIILSIEVFHFPAPTDLGIGVGGGKITIAWNYPEPLIGEVSHFEIFRKSTGDYVSLVNNFTDDYYNDFDLLNGVTYSYYVIAYYTNPAGVSLPSDEVSATATGVSDFEQYSPIIANSLWGNYPNPFNPETLISYTLASSDHVILEIFNLQGQKVKTLVNSFQTAGLHTILWKGDDNLYQPLGSSIYFYQLKTRNYTAIKKMVLLK